MEAGNMTPILLGIVKCIDSGVDVTISFREPDYDHVSVYKSERTTHAYKT